MVHEIHDLSDLIALLGAKPGSPLQLVIHPDVHKSLAGCLELGLNNIVSLNPMALAPRSLVRLRIPGDSLTPKAWPKDFEKYLSGSSESDLTPISVSVALLAEGLDWAGDYRRGERFDPIYSGLLTRVNVGNVERVEAPRGDVQEVVDWLDLIQRTRPNDVAKELRTDVKANNLRGLKAKIAQPKLNR
ncbi:hypothetical protein V0M98_35815 (plasmid) [Pseudomonas silesiensis]|uniref:hypothetical protein n=1 Tax=Pseudomonas silesiensis TaxID=1853130 RepID=UPI0030D22FB1